jgi:hypothetical protein
VAIPCGRVDFARIAMVRTQAALLHRGGSSHLRDENSHARRSRARTRRGCDRRRGR